MGRISEGIGITGEVWAVLKSEGRDHTQGCPWHQDQRAKACTCGVYEVHLWHNIISNSGDQFYAEAAAKGITGIPASTTEDFDTMSVATAVTTAFGTKAADCGDITTVPTGGTKAIDANYPRVNDPDTNNPGTVGVDIVTWKTTYTTSQGNGTIVGVAIHETGSVLGSGGDPLLMSADLSPTVVKTSGQSMAWYVNHRMDGQ